MRRWLGALLAPADDPRPRQSVPEERVGPADTDALLGELRRSREELSTIRQALRARLDEMPESQRERLELQLRERLELQLRELVAEEQQLLLAEQSLRLDVDERRAQRLLEQARRQTLEVALRVDDRDD